MKYIIVTGGVLSGIGKGITSSSTGLLLQRAGYKVTAVKIDPYLNVDAGTMNPYEHGEVFVMTDGSEVDLDLGNYERFLSCNLTKDHKNNFITDYENHSTDTEIRIVLKVTDEFIFDSELCCFSSD